VTSFDDDSLAFGKASLNTQSELLLSNENQQQIMQSGDVIEVSLDNVGGDIIVTMDTSEAGIQKPILHFVYEHQEELISSDEKSLVESELLLNDASLSFEQENFKNVRVVRYFDLQPGKYQLKLVC
jgi:hypothetical protein